MLESPAPGRHDSGLPLSLMSVSVLAHVGFTGARFALALAAIALGLSEAAVGAVLSVMMLAPIVLSIHAGRWGDVRGVLPPARSGILMQAAGCAAAALATSATHLSIAGALVGLGYILVHVTVPPALGRMAGPGRAPAAFSALSVGFSFSSMLGPMTAGLLVDHAGIAPAFLAMVAFTLLSGVMLARTAPRLPPPVPRPRAARSSSLELLKQRPLRRVLIVTGLMQIGWDMLVFLIPLYGTAIGLSATAMGIILVVFNVGTLAIRAVLPGLQARFGSWGLASLVLAVTAAGFALFPLFRTLGPLLPLSFVLGLALGASQPISLSLLHETAPPERIGEAVGMRSTLTSVSQSVLPMASGLLGALTGLAPVFWLTTVTLAAGAELARRFARAPAPPPAAADPEVRNDQQSPH